MKLKVVFANEIVTNFKLIILSVLIGSFSYLVWYEIKKPNYIPNDVLQKYVSEMEHERVSNDSISKIIIPKNAKQGGALEYLEKHRGNKSKTKRYSQDLGIKQVGNFYTGGPYEENIPFNSLKYINEIRERRYLEDIKEKSIGTFIISLFALIIGRYIFKIIYWVYRTSNFQ